MKKFLYLLALMPFAAFANPIDDNCPQHTTLGAPISSITTNTQYVCHGNYALHYRYDTKTAEYVVEHLDTTDITCGHCNKTVSKGMHARWHGDRCKNL
jgi:hypothetical protein